ncbi:MAG: hypothetical protein ABSE75_08810 [Acidimicrobiales bacterium]|jgi:hypothetical protein
MGKIHVTGYDNTVQSTVGSFIANLPEMLGAMAVDPRCLVAIAEFADVRYVQFWVEPNGRVIAEVISNLNIGDAVALTAHDERVLHKMGWSEPSPGPNPNWRYESSDVAGLMRVVLMTRHAVYEVLREMPGNVVNLKTWEFKKPRDVRNDEVRTEARVHYQTALREIAKQLDG